jgi:hypothetical protein
MNHQVRTTSGIIRRGQTLVVALIILGVLLVLGVVFIGLVGKTIRNTDTQGKRSLAYDLAESGVRYVHTQMLNSLQGLDWRPVPTVLPIRKDDPDYEFLRLPNPADTTDLGGPDKQGYYVRLNFDKGRALVRVRYAPSEPTIFATTQVGSLLQPGLARYYTMIEAVGKANSVNPNDPTQGSLQTGVVRENVESKKVVAFVSCGLLEHGLYITNKGRESRAAEIGWASESGVLYNDNGGALAPVVVPVTLGSSAFMFNPYDPNTSGGPTATAGLIPYGGGIYSNADLIIHGNVVANLNQFLGDGIFVNGTIRGADDQSSLTLNIGKSDNGAPPQMVSMAPVTLKNNANPPLNSDSPQYSTIGNIFRDGMPNGDTAGWPRSVVREEPPSALAVDPDTGTNRYIQMTRNSGRSVTTPSGNVITAGINGYGQGVFLNNTDDIQIPTDEQGRQDVGSAESLEYDWMNPNNGQAKSGWQGPYYVPRGAYLKLFNDGFMIIRDGKAPANQRTWKEPDGSPSKRPGASMTSTNPADIVDSPYIRYKLVRDPQSGQIYIFNTYSVMSNGNVIDNLNNVTSASMNTYRSAGYPFNGVLYFAGNVRVRGQIPTDIQMTVVSGGTIYIEGSITKGVINSGTRSNIQLGHRIDTPSKSMLALIAKDYVTVNTTMFFGSAPQQALEEVKDSGGPVEMNPVRVRTGGSLGLNAEELLDPLTPAAAGGNPLNPSTWKPYLTQYVVAGSVNNFEQTNLLFTQAMDDGPAAATFLNLDVNYQVGNAGVPDWQYLFELSNFNAASSFYAPGYVPPPYSVANRLPLYGLGAQSWQRYTKFESGAFTLVSSDFTFDPLTMLVSGANTSPTGLYHLLVEDTNDFTLGLHDTVGGTATNDYVLARTAIVPQDIRIEATIFAEDGSFFVIPGPWFNPNPNDRRDTYLTLGASTAERDLARLEDFGSTPNTPFFGEPLDVRIQVYGSVSENMPPSISQQTEWLKKWGWIPRFHGATNELIPGQHVPNGYNVTGTDQYVPNFTVIFDPALATGRNAGFVSAAGPAVNLNTLIRIQGVDVDGDGVNDVFYALPPLPRLPVSPSLAYFGEVKP